MKHILKLNHACWKPWWHTYCGLKNSETILLYVIWSYVGLKLAARFPYSPCFRETTGRTWSYETLQSFYTWLTKLAVVNYGTYSYFLTVPQKSTTVYYNTTGIWSAKSTFTGAAILLGFGKSRHECMDNLGGRLSRIFCKICTNVCHVCCTVKYSIYASLTALHNSFYFII